MLSSQRQFPVHPTSNGDNMQSLAQNTTAKVPFIKETAPLGNLVGVLYVDGIATATPSAITFANPTGKSKTYFASVPLPVSMTDGSVCSIGLEDDGLAAGEQEIGVHEFGIVEPSNSIINTNAAAAKAAAERTSAGGMYYRETSSPVSKAFITSGFDAGITTYGVITRENGDYWDNSAIEWTASPTWSTVDIDTYEYQGQIAIFVVDGTTIPSAAEPNMIVQLRQQAGASPADTDLVIGRLSGSWDGSTFTESNGDAVLDKIAEVKTAVDELTAKHSTTIAVSTDARNFTLSTGTPTDGIYRGMIATVIKSGESTTFDSATVDSYTGSTKAIKLNKALRFTPSAGDTVELSIAQVAVAPQANQSVPSSRSIEMVPGVNGLEGEKITLTTSDSRVLYSLDYHLDLPDNDGLASVVSVTTVDSEVTAVIEGVHDTEAKLLLSGVSASTDSLVQVVVKYEDDSVKSSKFLVDVKA